MSYGISAALQEAVYARLLGSAQLTEIVGSAVYDELPPGPMPSLYVALGLEKVRDASDVATAAARHDFTVSVVTESAGFQTAKAAAGAVSDTLNGGAMTLGRGHLVGLWFRQARATRESGGLRRIDMTFRAHVEDD